MKNNNEKLEVVVHYICARCTKSHNLSATRLNKILFYADMTHYYQTGVTLTGTTYKKSQHGPVPSEILQSVKALEQAKKLKTLTVDCYGYKKKEYISLQEPNLENIEKYEIDLLSYIMDSICNNHTTNSISEASHDFVWEAAAMGEKIPMSAYIAAKSGNINKPDKDWASQIIASL